MISKIFKNSRLNPESHNIYQNLDFLQVLLSNVLYED